MTVSPRFSRPHPVRSRGVTAVLGPTNTGKTHLAIERMLGHSSGIIGLPLRLLAREVYGRVAARAGEDQVALVTGEERIVPPNPRYWVCTVEAMPRETDAAFAAIDEVQLAGDLERGHIFTDRILSLRGREETLLLGAATIRPLIEKLLPGVAVVTRPRMSQLSYSGQKKITRLPRRSAVVAFSAGEVYAIAELIRRQRGGAAVVLGALSPRTRNAQVALYQSGDVDFLVATDAIGMGLNLDVDHVAFASRRKFDGYQFRDLSSAEMAQIAGRAGRHTRDGTFGVTGRVDPLDDDLVEMLETHAFQPMSVLQWRNPDLDFTSLADLKASLELVPSEEGLTRAPPATDVAALEAASGNEEVIELASSEARLRLLWEVCQVPDYRKIAPANHADLVCQLYSFLAHGRIPVDWFSAQVALTDNTEGDIDTLANRIAHVRTWTFVAHKADWLDDPVHWQELTRAIEDRLSDALHEKLTQRFVDRRTSVLMRRLRENAMLDAEITPDGDVMVEGHVVGHLHGFRFAPDASAEGPDGKALRNAAQKALAGEIQRRAERLAAAANEAFVLSSDGSIRFEGEAVARLVAGSEVLKPGMVLLADGELTGPPRDKVEARIGLWLASHIRLLLKPLVDLAGDESLQGTARGLAFRLVESLGILDRREVAEEVRNLPQEARAGLRRHGVRFGAYHVFVPALLKPAPSGLLAMLWALKEGGLDRPGLAELAQHASAGRTSIPVDPAIPRALYRASGFRVVGPRAVRIDILERLADIIRPLLAQRGGGVQRPDGAVEGDGFVVTSAMTSLLGCAGEDFAAVLRSLGYRSEKRSVTRPKGTASARTEVQATPAAATGDGDSAGGPAADEAAAAAPALALTPQQGEAAPDAPARTVEGAQAPAGAASAPPVAPQPALPLDEAPDSLAEAETAPTSDAPAPTEDTTAETVAAPGIEMETVEIEVWRVARGERARREKRPQRGRGRPPADGEPEREDGRHPPKQGRRGKPHGVRRPQPDTRESLAPPRRDERKPDPDSPFAALAALKKDLEERSKRSG